MGTSADYYVVKKSMLQKVRLFLLNTAPNRQCNVVLTFTIILIGPGECFYSYNLRFKAAKIKTRFHKSRLTTHFCHCAGGVREIVQSLPFDTSLIHLIGKSAVH